MKLCDYGCGQEAKFQLKNGKWCCCDKCNKCIAVRLKNSNSRKKSIRLKCRYCDKEVSGSNIHFHEEICQLNPNNYKILIKNSGWYGKVYNSIIEKRRKCLPKGYYERHHIIPKSVGGSNSRANIICLSGREHFICHALLTRIYRNEEQNYKKMLNAFILMKGNPRNENERYFNSKLYESAKIKFKEICRENLGGTKNPNFNKRWVYNPKLNEEEFISVKEIPYYINKGYVEGTRKSFFREIIRKEKIQKYKDFLNRNRRMNEEFIKQALPFYEKHGWEETRKKFNIAFSQQNFVMKCKQYNENFKPTKGKPRGKKNPK